MSAGPNVREWTPEVDALAQLLDAVLIIRSELWALAQQKPPPFKPTLRPRTAFDRVQEARRERLRRHIEGVYFPEGR